MKHTPPQQRTYNTRLQNRKCRGTFLSGKTTRHPSCKHKHPTENLQHKIQTIENTKGPCVDWRDKPNKQQKPIMKTQSSGDHGSHKYNMEHRRGLVFAVKENKQNFMKTTTSSEATTLAYKAPRLRQPRLKT